MQFIGEDLYLAGQLGVGFELQFLSSIVVVGFGLLEGSLAVLADHDERRQEDRFERHDQSQYRPRVRFQYRYPHGEKDHVNEDEVHRAGECGDAIRQPRVEILASSLRLLQHGWMVDLTIVQQPVRNELGDAPMRVEAWGCPVQSLRVHSAHSDLVVGANARYAGS